MNEVLAPFINKYKHDGVDHIRISPFADTDLGKILSPDWRKKFFIPALGEFLSPECFANWITTGNEEARFDHRVNPERSIPNYNSYVLYAKFFQLCRMKTGLIKPHIDLPFVRYNVLTSGLRQYSNWESYADEVRKMVDHINDPERGTKVPYPIESVYPDVKMNIENNIKAILKMTAA